MFGAGHVYSRSLHLTNPSFNFGGATMLFSVMDAQIHASTNNMQRLRAAEFVLWRITTMGKLKFFIYRVTKFKLLQVTILAEVKLPSHELRSHSGRPWTSIQPFRPGA